MDEQPIRVTVDRDLEELIPGFMERRREDTNKLRAALAEHDLETLRIIGHSMKGTGGGYGFTGLSEIGAGIEAAAKAGDLDAVRAQLDTMVDYLARLEVQFE